MLKAKHKKLSSFLLAVKIVKQGDKKMQLVRNKHVDSSLALIPFVLGAREGNGDFEEMPIA